LVTPYPDPYRAAFPVARRTDERLEASRSREAGGTINPWISGKGDRIPRLQLQGNRKTGAGNGNGFPKRDARLPMPAEAVTVLIPRFEHFVLVA
jgi:hypothetical protein